MNWMREKTGAELMNRRSFIGWTRRRERAIAAAAIVCISLGIAFASVWIVEVAAPAVDRWLDNPQTGETP